MRYFVTLGDAEVAVDVKVLPDGGYQVEIDGKRIDADVVMLPDAMSVRIGHRVIDLMVEGKPPNLGAIGAGIRTYANVESERHRAATAATVGTRRVGANSVTSPMPGRIVKVMVKEGDEVQLGDAVVVVEAMKMENELRAPRQASIAKVLVKEGDRVEGGAVLIEFA